MAVIIFFKSLFKFFIVSLLLSQLGCYSLNTSEKACIFPNLSFEHCHHKRDIEDDFSVDDVVSAYKTVASIPTLSSANIMKSGKSVISYYSVRNLETTSTSKFKYSYTLDDKLQVIAESEFPNEITNEALSSISPTERLRAIVRNQTDTYKKQYLEIWFAKSMKQCIDLTALEIHGDVYADAEFSCLSWSPDETHIAYIAEKNLAKSEPFIKRRSLKDSKNSCLKDAPTVKGEQYLYKQDWGEQLIGKYLSVIVVCELSTETFTIIQGLPESWCPGQVIWAPDGKSLIGIAWETEPRRLGLISCTNRPSFLFNVTLDGKNTVLTGAGKAIRSPRFSKDGKILVWLQRASGGPHHSCQQIVKTKWPLAKQYTYYDYLVSYATLDLWAQSADNIGSTAVTTVVDIVQTHISTVGGELFYGVYSQSLPRRAFVADGVRLAFSTAQKTEIRSYIVNTYTNKIVDISDRTSAGSTNILDIEGDYILANKTSLNQPYQLIVAQLPEAGKEHDIKWHTIGDAAVIPDIVRTSEVHYMDLKHEKSSDLIKDFNAIYFAPTTNKNKTLPLVVWPHGGPHSSSYNAYSLTASLFAYLGFASLQVNFRGSTGSGEATIKYLPGHVGSADVHDCKLAVEQAVSQYPIDPKKIVLFGGSHGGFLVTHLSGQYPDDFVAVVSRNPVIDIASMINTTDIPDWCAVEAGYDFTEKGPVKEMQLLAMRRFSPLVYVQNVKAPTALMLGSNDKRVPFYQGIEYYNRLKANGCITRLYLYEDNHSLSTLAVEMDNLINGLWWFIQHLQ